MSKRKSGGQRLRESLPATNGGAAVSARFPHVEEELAELSNEELVRHALNCERLINQATVEAAAIVRVLDNRMRTESANRIVTTFGMVVRDDDGDIRFHAPDLGAEEVKA